MGFEPSTFKGSTGIDDALLKAGLGSNPSISSLPFVFDQFDQIVTRFGCLKTWVGGGLRSTEVAFLLRTYWPRV